MEPHALLLQHGLVALLDDALHELLDVLADERVEQVDDPVAGQAVDVALLGQVGAHLAVLGGLLEEVVYGEPLVVGGGEDLDRVRLHVCTGGQHKE